MTPPRKILPPLFLTKYCNYLHAEYILKVKIVKKTKQTQVYFKLLRQSLPIENEPAE